MENVNLSAVSYSEVCGNILCLCENLKKCVNQMEKQYDLDALNCFLAPFAVGLAETQIKFKGTLIDIARQYDVSLDKIPPQEKTKCLIF